MKYLGKLRSHFPSIAEFNSCSQPRNRGNWKRSYIGTLALLGFTIGSGDFMYFPGLIAKYNGAFLLPYVVLLFYVSIPLFAFEMALGQYLSVGPIKAFGRLAPILTGFGSGMVLISLIVSIYYNIYLATNLVLLWRNFLFWTRLGNQTNYEEIISDICSSFASNSNISTTPMTEQPFFSELLTCFGVSWLIVGLCLARGYHTSSKLIIISQMVPYFLLAVLVAIYFELEVIMAHTIEEHVVPQASKVSYLSDLFDSTIWFDALKHVIFSTGIGFGAITTLASFNTPQHNFIRDSWVVPLANFGTSAMYTLLISKYLSTESDSYLSVVCVYSRVDSIKPIAGLVYLMFYFMTLSCQLAHVDTVVTAVFDVCNLAFDSSVRLPIVLLIVFVQFLLGIFICFSYNYYILMRSFGERIIMTNIFLEAFAAPFIFFKFDMIKTKLRLKNLECVENHLLKCWILIAPILIWVIIIWAYSSGGFTSSDESPFVAILISSLYLVFISIISYIACWKSEENVLRAKDTFCVYKEPPTKYTLPVESILNLPGTPRPHLKNRITGANRRLECLQVESTYL